ncbi:MAG TPA: hypothetical protein VMZ27_07165 [Candidatus Saccharimonadales bacterium]|nr:hypothetical protein [Candidatus Saccharimonadales bacterium]
MPKWVKLLLGILLLPICVGAVRALFMVIGATGRADTIWVALIGGAACWLTLFLLLPKPMRVYVFGHELTHAVWTWLFGGRVKKFKVTSKGGHVIVTKSNFVIALAPYFFPLYAALTVLVFVLGNLLWNWAGYRVWFHFLLGAAYAFHLTLTAHILKTEQSDITSQGYLFSAVIIFLGNVSVLLIGLPLLTTQLSLATSLGWWLQESGAVVLKLRNVL